MGQMQWRRMTLGICPVFLHESADLFLCLRQKEREKERENDKELRVNIQYLLRARSVDRKERVFPKTDHWSKSHLLLPAESDVIAIVCVWYIEHQSASSCTLSTANFVHMRCWNAVAKGILCILQLVLCSIGSFWCHVCFHVSSSSHWLDPLHLITGSNKHQNICRPRNVTWLTHWLDPNYVITLNVSQCGLKWYDSETETQVWNHNIPHFSTNQSIQTAVRMKYLSSVFELCLICHNCM